MELYVYEPIGIPKLEEILTLSEVLKIRRPTILVTDSTWVDRIKGECMMLGIDDSTIKMEVTEETTGYIFSVQRGYRVSYCIPKELKDVFTVTWMSDFYGKIELNRRSILYTPQIFS